jgi:hypothetical protein
MSEEDRRLDEMMEKERIKDLERIRKKEENRVARKF